MRERHLYIRKKKAARKPLCDDRCDAVDYCEELGELLLPLLPGLVLGVVDWSGWAFFSFCVFFLVVVVSPEEPDVFTPDVSVALGDEPLVTLLLSLAAPPMDEPDEPDGPPMDEPEDPDAPPMDEPDEPDVPEDPEELPLVPVSLCDFIGED